MSGCPEPTSTVRMLPLRVKHFDAGRGRCGW
jgi:hypothetical protein